MMKALQKILNFLSDIIFTVRCPYCKTNISPDDYACTNCKEKFPDSSVATYTTGNYPCVSPFLYEGIFANAVKSFKFRNDGAYAKQFAFMIVSSINELYNGEKFDIITCVPMHKNALKERRYNQSELLAKECAELMNIPFMHTLEKFKENQKQHRIKASERAENVRGVFKAINKEAIKNKNILIIDDIITTGNTLGECAKILKYAGCSKISCATLCTTVYNR